MLGAIAGDIIGSLHEFNGNKRADLPLFGQGSFFTDDSVLTIATAEKLLTGGNYAALYRKWARLYPDSGFGGRFARWFVAKDAPPYNSFGNGSAMRVSPVGWAFDTLEETLAEARRSALPTHDHPEGIKGAESVAAAIFMARKGAGKKEILQYIQKTFDYDLSRSVEEIRLTYHFDETCQGSVPQAIRCFLEGKSYEETVRLAVSLGGDADTQACIAGSIAEAAFGLPKDIALKAREALPLEMLAVLGDFKKKFML